MDLGQPFCTESQETPFFPDISQRASQAHYCSQEGTQKAMVPKVWPLRTRKHCQTWHWQKNLPLSQPPAIAVVSAQGPPRVPPPSPPHSLAVRPQSCPVLDLCTTALPFPVLFRQKGREASLVPLLIFLRGPVMQRVHQVPSEVRGASRTDPPGPCGKDVFHKYISQVIEVPARSCLILCSG